MKGKRAKKGSRLEAIRDAHSAEGQPSHTYRMEDYLEVIYELIKEKGYASAIDISEYLNVSSPSVTKMMQKLDGSGHLNYERYRGIMLTDQGTTIAKGMHERHNLLVEFFKIIGVRDEIANRDAEGIEHHLHPETLKKLEQFVKTWKRVKTQRR